MATKRDDPLFGGIHVDPDLAEAFGRSAATNRAALTERQKRERQRVYQRVDMPAWLKEQLFAAAEGEDVSASQFSAFMLAWALDRYQARDPELMAMIERCKVAVRSLNAGQGLELYELEERLLASAADSAEGLLGAFQAGTQADK